MGLLMMDNRKTITLLLLPLFLLSCITTYRDFPTTMVGRKPENKRNSTLYYQIKPFPILDFGGEKALNDVFKHKSIFANTEAVSEIPREGIYCLVETQWMPLSMPALIFGYISIIYLTILPAWSTQEGYVVRYHLFVNGEKKETFEYEITRKTGLWIVFLPFAWINFLTYSEAEAFEATAYQFFEEASPIFSNF